MVHYDDEDNPSSLGLLPVMGDSTPGAGRDGSVGSCASSEEGCRRDAQVAGELLEQHLQQ